jgi:hypothetical protein
VLHQKIEQLGFVCTIPQKLLPIPGGSIHSPPNAHATLVSCLRFEAILNVFVPDNIHSMHGHAAALLQCMARRL